MRRGTRRAAPLRIPSMSAPTRRPRALVTATLAALSFGGCKKGDLASTAPLVAHDLIIAQGDGQQRQAYRKLYTPLVFRTTDDAGVGVANIPISLVVDEGGGSVDSASIKTDPNGEARVHWTLGGTPVQSLTASAPGVHPVHVSATALLPSDIVIVQGNNQTARAGNTLPVAVVVRVLGPGNVPLDTLPVSLQIASGGGTIAPQTVMTNGLGEASVKWTLGLTGTNTAYVRVGTLDPTVITATATP